jgi:hypothetical protein
MRWQGGVLALLALALAGCGAGGFRAAATATPSIKIEVGTTASVDDVQYVAVQRIAFERLARDRVEAAGEVRIPELVRRIPAYRLKDSPKAALRYTEDEMHGWWAWQPLVVLHARRELARKENLPLGQILTVDVQHETWSDLCLGTGRPGEECRSEVIPGFRVLLRFAAKQFEVHTDLKERALVAPA